MPLIFQVLRCYKCLIFQVHQTKKSNKFQCKVCGEKQSIKRHYGLGTGKECREHVQKLNIIRGEIEEQNLNETYSDFEDRPVSPLRMQDPINQSVWQQFIESEPEERDKPAEKMCLNEIKVVLEMPRKRTQKLRPKYKQKKIKGNTNGESDDENDTYTKTHSQDLNKYYNLDSCNKKSTNISDIPKRSDYSDEDKKDQYKQLETYNFRKRDIYLQETSRNNNLIFSTSTCSNMQLDCPKSSDILIENPKFTVTGIKKDSIWAQFVEEDEAKNSDENELPIIDTVQNNYHTNSKPMFSLCDEDDIDNVLDI